MDDKAARAWVSEQLVRLIGIASPSHREHEAVEFLETLCDGLGFPVARIPVSGAADDLVVSWGSASPSLLLNAHIDTIEPSWDRSGTPAIRDGEVHGLGAIDDKGGIVACLLGLLLAREAGTDLDAGFVALGFTVDEELSGTGSIVMANRLRPRQVVVAEGTDLEIGVSEAGCVDVWLRLHGASVHGALRDEGVNAAEAAVRMVTELLELPMTKEHHPRHGRNVPMLWQIRAGDPLNVVPDLAEVHFDVRVVPGSSAQALCDAIAATAARHGAQLEIVEVAEPFEGAADGLLVRRLLTASSRVLGSAPKLCGVQAWTDAHSFVELSGSEAVVFGPGHLRRAHAPGESIEINTIVACARVFAELIANSVAAAQADGEL
jgi:acetylornithine deacetylase/succinyl-diaminopimelate desuccinylase-like protein